MKFLVTNVAVGYLLCTAPVVVGLWEASTERSKATVLPLSKQIVQTECWTFDLSLQGFHPIVMQNGNTEGGSKLILTESVHQMCLSSSLVTWQSSLVTLCYYARALAILAATAVTMMC